VLSCLPELCGSFQRVTVVPLLSVSFVDGAYFVMGLAGNNSIKKPSSFSFFSSIKHGSFHVAGNYFLPPK